MDNIDFLVKLAIIAFATMIVFGIVQLADWDIRNDEERYTDPYNIRAAVKFICYTFGSIWLAVELHRWWGLLTSGL